MSTAKTTSKKGPSHNIIERLKMFMDAFIKQLKKTSVKEIPAKKTKPKVKTLPAKETKPKVKPAPKKTAVKSKTAATRKTKPKANTGV